MWLNTAETKMEHKVWQTNITECASSIKWGLDSKHSAPFNSIRSSANSSHCSAQLFSGNNIKLTQHYKNMHPEHSILNDTGSSWHSLDSSGICCLWWNSNVPYHIHKAQQWILTQATLIQLNSISENSILNSIFPTPPNTQICHVGCTCFSSIPCTIYILPTSFSLLFGYESWSIKLLDLLLLWGQNTSLKTLLHIPVKQHTSDNQQ